jgi:Flp pilus assembly protein TadD
LPGVEPSLDKAVHFAHRGANLEPANQLTRTIRAFVCLLQGDKVAFDNEIESALALNPNSPYYVGTNGFLLVCFGDFDRGYELLRRAIGVHPNHPKWFHNGCSIYHFQRGEYEEALREVQEAGSAHWDESLRAVILHKLGRITEARTAIDASLEQEPHFPSRVRVTVERLIRVDQLVEDLIYALRDIGVDVDG